MARNVSQPNGNESMSSKRSNQTIKIRKSGERFAHFSVDCSAFKRDSFVEAQLIVRFDLTGWHFSKSILKEIEYR
jgi:hypothetical protein